MKRILIALIMAGAAATAVAGLMASEDRGEREHEYGEHGGVGGTGYVHDPAYEGYRKECGDCHMAYPPSMLPAGSWQEVMATLGDHFGDSAELDAATSGEITAFLERHSAGHDGGLYSERAYRATRGQRPLRITQTDYFVGKHHEIPRTMVADNPDVKSFSRCNACHGGADRGSFTEHDVRIPHYGRWDD